MGASFPCPFAVGIFNSDTPTELLTNAQAPVLLPSGLESNLRYESLVTQLQADSSRRQIKKVIISEYCSLLAAEFKLLRTC